MQPADRSYRPIVCLGVLVLLGVLLTGCIGDDTSRQPELAPADEETTPTSDRDRVTRTSVDGCIGYSVQASVPWAPVAQALPEGFTPVPYFAGPATPVMDGRRAQAFFDGWRCQQARVGDTPVAETILLLPKVEVQPPSELAPPGEQRSYIPLFLATDNRELAETFSAWGIAAEAGDPLVEGLGQGPARTGHVRGTAADTTMEIRVSIGETPASSFTVSGEASRYFVTDPPLFHGDAQVTSVLDRFTGNATAALGHGQVRLTGSGAGQALGPIAPGVGFDTQDGGWGEAFHLRVDLSSTLP